MTDPASRRAAAALAATLLIWAYSWVVMKQALAYAGPFDFAALRYLLGAATLFAVLLAARQPLAPPPLWPTALVGLAQTAAFQGLEQWALVDGGAGRVALLAYTMPFWAVALAWPLLRERPARAQGLGVALAALGLACILEPWRGLGGARSSALAVGGGAAWALGTVLSKRLFQRHAVAPLNFAAWQMLIGALALGAAALAVPQRPLQWTPALLAALAYSVVVASSAAWALWLFALRHLSATVASLSSLGVPVFSVLLAWAILGERPSPAEAAGIALVLLGLVAVNWRRRPV
ncbi:DMT family transporter [Fulvimonas soli]|uniref:EamA domain-containing membrane protein RarD n=1 Tax=Fulvimonas soli TaxID=155197 RepID=A0A316HMZ2_9GAMM|nr:EamA family transporter [Fulvimonas soli]PWK82111.1 EamA domain-containing membrane protein RarD [Fulvimonas soli]TNY27018.1 EamA family transporter [Fulvimonas soli]